MKTNLSLILASAAAAALTPAQAQVAFVGAYAQNFNTLATAGSGIPWADNSTLAGWYASQTSYAAGTGSSLTGAMYSFGDAGGPSSGDRALGSVGSSGTGTVAYGVRFQNTAGVNLSSIQVSYVGEQWRFALSTLPPTLAQSVTVWYRTGVGLTALTPSSNVGWTAVPVLNFTSPNTFGAAAAPLNGNAFTNRVAVNATLTGVTLAPGEELMIRWLDVDHPNNDHGLAIDDFSVTALTVVPEPATWALLGGGLIFLASRLRRRD